MKKKVILVVDYLFFIAVIAYMYKDVFRIIDQKKIGLFEVNSPMLYCFVIATVAAIFLAIDLVANVLLPAVRAKKAVPSGQDGTVSCDACGSGEGKLKEILWILILMAGQFVYIFSMKYIPFIPATMVYLFAFMFVLNKDAPKKKRLIYAAIAACVAAPVLYFVFDICFGVLLP